MALPGRYDSLAGEFPAARPLYWNLSAGSAGCSSASAAGSRWRVREWCRKTMAWNSELVWCPGGDCPGGTSDVAQWYPSDLQSCSGRAGASVSVPVFILCCDRGHFCRTVSGSALGDAFAGTGRWVSGAQWKPDTAWNADCLYAGFAAGDRYWSGADPQLCAGVVLSDRCVDAGAWRTDCRRQTASGGIAECYRTGCSGSYRSGSWQSDIRKTGATGWDGIVGLESSSRGKNPGSSLRRQ